MLGLPVKLVEGSITSFRYFDAGDFESNIILIFVYIILTLRDERRLRVFDNRVLRRVFGLRGMR